MSISPLSPSLDHELAERLDAVWGDPAVWVAHGLHWTHLEPVRHHINRQVTGDPDMGSVEWFMRHLGVSAECPLERVLVLGCGQGHVEQGLARKGWVRELVASDLSAQVLEHARAKAEQAGHSIRYLQADMNQLPLGQPGFERGSFDAVLGVACIHHCENLEQLYADVAALMKPDGWFFLDEYVGPDRFQFSSAQLRCMNQLMDLLPERLRQTRDGRVKANLQRPSVQEVVTVDPSEAVRSSEVLERLDPHFEIHARRPYGGVLLRVLLSDIAQNFMSPAAQPYLSALMAAEEELLRSGRLQHDLVCVVARRRGVTGAAAPGSWRSRSSPPSMPDR